MKRFVLLGVTGGIAAYKSAELCRRLVRAGIQVQVVMSEAACRFITPLTMETLSGRPVRTKMFGTQSHSVEHVELGADADLLVVAPATADFLARAATGRASDLISAVTLAFSGPVLAAPAMNTNMWNNPATRRNLALLTAEHGWQIVQPGSGELACGWSGPGRMAEPAEIQAACLALLQGDLGHLSLLVTAGPTVEDIDPVRFLTNRSSGRMGYALAQEAARRGAKVVLCSGPSALETPAGVELVPVRSALEMEGVLNERAAEVDVVIMAAAVADFRPLEPSAVKLKKKPGEKQRTLELVRNPDILAGLGRRFAGVARPLLVGFAVETGELVPAARAKLSEKKIDLVVANPAATAFGGQDNEAVIIEGQGQPEHTGQLTKVELARRILDRLAARLAPDT